MAASIRILLRISKTSYFCDLVSFDSRPSPLQIMALKQCQDDLGLGKLRHGERRAMSTISIKSRRVLYTAAGSATKDVIST